MGNMLHGGRVGSVDAPVRQESQLNSVFKRVGYCVCLYEDMGESNDQMTSFQTCLLQIINYLDLTLVPPFRLVTLMNAKHVCDKSS